MLGVLLMQPPKRGLSLEEKRSKLLEVFHESKDVFVLKVRCMHACMQVPPCLHVSAQHLALPAATSDWMHTGHRKAWRQERHRIAEHQGGAAGTQRCSPFKYHRHLQSAMLAETCIALSQSLVDDDLVHQEKIGSSNYYWCTQQ